MNNIVTHAQCIETNELAVSVTRQQWIEHFNDQQRDD